LIVIDLAKFWTAPREQIGADLESVVEQTCRVLAAARAAHIPVFFTTYAFDCRSRHGLR
jgi:nicotinamidase-related amidase